MNKKTIVASLIFIFLFSLIIRGYPLRHRGYPAEINTSSLILARNLSLTGKYSFESENNIVLSSALIEEKGVLSDRSNKLTTFLYKYIFDVFGFQPDLAVQASLIIFALTNVVLFLLVLKLFNFYLAFLFSIIDILMPFVIRGSGIAGFYEWAMLFFVIALLFYLYDSRKLNLFFAGFFFTLAFWARNAFLISFIPFVCYDFWKNRSYKRIIILLLPFIIFSGIFLRSSNSYINTFLTKTDAGYEGHLFPDPYTYHFEKEEYIESVENPTGEQMLFFPSYGAVSFKQKLSSHLHSLKFYIRETLRIVTLGGIWMVLLMALGLGYLYRKKNPLLKLILLWGAFWICSLVFLRTSNWDHFLEIRFPIVLLISLGVYWIIDLVGERIDYKYLWAIILLMTVSLHLIEASRWTFHETYNNSQTDIVLNMVSKVKEKSQQDDIIGAGISETALNYYTDRNFIYFNPRTVQKLLGEDCLAWAFQQFGVTQIVGFNSDLSEEIVNQTGIENIASLKEG